MKRREFLAAAGSGSVVFAALGVLGGVRVVNATAADAARLASADAVLVITGSGEVIFTSPYTEMGQGSPTGASMILADELHTDLDAMVIRNHDGRIVQTDPTYGARFNGGGSGGSQSMATAWPAIREIGAAARTTLIETAAAAWAVNAADCETAPDRVVHRSSGRSLAYAELVAEAAKRDVPDEPRYRDPADYRYVGTGRARADMDAILTGRAPYAIDQSLENLVYASIERCPYRTGTVDSFDREAVLAVRGVSDVFAIDPQGAEPAARRGIAVIGRDTWSAMQGRKALNAKWLNPEPAYADEAAFWTAMGERLDAGNPNGEVSVGDFENADLQGLASLTREYRLGYQNQTPMEPITITAHHRGDAFELWVSTQYPSDFRDRIGEMTGLPQDKITIHNTIMGGSFGRRFVRDALTEVIVIAIRLRRPVKVTWTREDDLRAGQYRNASLSRVQAHYDDTGAVRRWRQQAVGTTPRDPSDVKSLGDGMSDQPYRFTPARFEMSGIKANVNLGPMRSPPHPAKLFPTVCFIDELAHELGEDPIDLHIRLIGEPRFIEQGEWLAGNGHEDNTATHVQVAQAVRRLSRWDEPLPDGHGKGFAMGYFFGTHIATVVEVAWRDGMISIEKAWCAVNCGRVINPDAARQQVEGGFVYGLSSAMGEVITTRNGAVQEGNFDTYPLMRLAQAPDVEVEFIDSDERPSGLGEPGTPPAYPALANAIFAASGKRIREIPLARHIRFAPSRRFNSSRSAA